MPVIDLNADAGEGYDDAGLLQVVTSASLACGGHVGDVVSLRPVVELAASRGVTVGAQVSYVDREGFGRRKLDTPAEVLRQQLDDQFGLLQSLCQAAGTAVGYVKPHGALYHRTLLGGPQADEVAALASRNSLPLLMMSGSPYTSVPEGYADRAYDGNRLRPRSQPGAVLTEPEAVAAQAVSLAPTHRSLCVHGDSPGAVALATAVRHALEEAGWELAAFA